MPSIELTEDIPGSVEDRVDLDTPVHGIRDLTPKLVTDCNIKTYGPVLPKNFFSHWVPRKPTQRAVDVECVWTWNVYSLERWGPQSGRGK